MEEKTLTILVTGVGAPGTRGTLYALRKNPHNTKLRIIGVDGREDALGKLWVEKFKRVPYPEEESYLDTLLEICEKEQVDIVLPQTTRETGFLSKHKKEFRSRKIGITVSESNSVEIANNKFRLLKKFQDLGLPCPNFFLACSEKELRQSVTELGYPNKTVVVKPPISNGMRGYRELREEENWDVKRFLSEKPSSVSITLENLVAILSRGRWPDLLVSEYLDGEEFSVDAFRGKKSSIAIPRVRKKIVNGISFDTEITERKDLVDYTLKAANDIDLEFAFGLQYKLDEENIPKVLECNPRVQGTMVASVFSGVNVIWLAVQEALGKSPSSVFSASSKITPARFIRCWGGAGLRNGSLIDEI